MPVRICLVTPGHISSNPRLMKEAITLVANKYTVHIIFTQNLRYLNIEDQKILEKNPKISFEIINVRYFTKVMHKMLFEIIGRLRVFGLHNFIYSKGYYKFLTASKKFNADLYIAHNLAALPIAVQAAKKNKAKCGFDAEDFHRNEVSDDQKDFQVKLKIFIENKYLKQVDYLTTASPLIAKSYQSLYPNLRPIVINNVFELKHQPELSLNQTKHLKLFWFSQTIGKNRGLEDVIEALNIINNPLLELHLLGYLDQNDSGYFDDLANFDINYHKPVSNSNIFELASQFDIGLALERKQPLNRDICLTNKIFTYLISGLAIIASNTKAQRKFICENPNIGSLYSIGQIDELVERIETLFEDRTMLNVYKANAYELAQIKYNWEMESKQFINIVEKTLHN